MSPQISVSVKNISKKYENVSALKSVSFEVYKGELFGLIGPDAAGKTTIMRILASLLLPDEGTATVCNHDINKDFRKIRKIIGYMPGRFSLYQDLTVEENLHFFSTVFGASIKENYEIIRDIYIQIEPFKKRRAGALSGGMKQKLALSCALIHKPEILILDEPTTGVDAVSRMEFWEILKKLKENNITIIVSTPYMDEASLCDRVALIQSGYILSIDTPTEIINSFDKKILSIKTDNMYKLITDLSVYHDIESVYPFGQYAHITFVSDKPEKSEIEIFLLKNGHSRIIIKEEKPCIEDCFMRFMNTKNIQENAK